MLSLIRLFTGNIIIDVIQNLSSIPILEEFFTSINENDADCAGMFALLSRASIPIYRWRQMRHGQFWGNEQKVT